MAGPSGTGVGQSAAARRSSTRTRCGCFTAPMNAVPAPDRTAPTSPAGTASGAVDRFDGEPVGGIVVEQHEDQIGLGDLAGAAGDQLQRLGAAYLPEQDGGDLGGGGEPPLATLRQREESGVVDGDAGRGGERHHDLLVVLGELGGAELLGEVEVAEDLAPDADGDAQEAVHRRVVLGKAVRPRMPRDVRHPHRAGVGDEQTQNTSPAR